MISEAGHSFALLDWEVDRAVTKPVIEDRKKTLGRSLFSQPRERDEPEEDEAEDEEADDEEEDLYDDDEDEDVGLAP